MLTPELAQKVDLEFQQRLRGRIMPGWVWVSEEQFDEIGLLVPKYTKVATLRRQHDTDDLVFENREVHPDPFYAACVSVLRIHIEEVVEAMKLATQEGKRFVFSPAPRVNLQREAYKLEVFTWLHYRSVEPRRNRHGNEYN